MGANAQTSVPLFSAGQVLTAADQNLSAGTGVPVFATTTTRDAAFGGANEKVLAEGQLCYIEASNIVQYYDGAAWATLGPASAGALVFITSASFTTATSFSLPNNTFSSTYRNYKLIASITAVTGACTITGRIRSGGADVTSAKYYQMSVGLTEGAGASNQGESGQTSFALGNGGDASYPNWNLSVDILQPQVSTVFNPICGSLQFFNGTNYIGRAFNATYNNGTTATSYDSFSVISSVASSLTGVYRVYGYADS